MTYGFQVLNNNGQVLVNDTDFNWGLQAEGTLTFNSIDPLTARSPAQFLPTASTTNNAPPPLIFIRMPTSRRVALVRMDRSGISFQGTIQIRWAPSISIADTPDSINDPFPVTVEYKMYSLMRTLTPPAGENFGLVVYDANGVVTFDSRLKPAIISDLVSSNFEVWNGNYGSNSAGISTTNSSSLNVSGLGTPWIATNDVIRVESYTGMYYSDTGTRRYFDSAYQLINNKVVSRYLIYYPSSNISQFGSAPLHWNNNSGKSAKVFIMRGDSKSLTGWITKIIGTSSCAGTGCQTSEDFKVDWVGGNSNSVTDSWQLVNATSNNFSLSYPATQNARVNLSNVSTGTYTATLRCTLSQSGSSSIIIDYSISRTHTSITVNNPIPLSSGLYTEVQDDVSIIIFSANSNGTASITGSISGVLWSGNWATPTTTNIGSGYWIRYTVSGTPSGGGSNTGSTGWLQLNTTRNVTVDATATTANRFRTVTYNIDIATNSTGTNIVSSTTVTLTASAVYTGEGGGGGSQINYSGYFDGNDDYLTIATNSQLSPGSSSFTIEMWIYPTAYVGTNSLWDFFHKGRVPTADYEYAFGVDFDGSGVDGRGWLTLYIAQDGVNWVRYRSPNTSTININNWYHIAVSKVGTTAYYLLNGTLVGTATVDANIPARSGALAIANNNIGTNPDYTGYISNVRLTVGQALYTSNYSVPTQPLTAGSNTRLLTLKQSTLSDESSNNFTITNPGNVTVSTFNPFS